MDSVAGNSQIGVTKLCRSALLLRIYVIYDVVKVIWAGQNTDGMRFDPSRIGSGSFNGSQSNETGSYSIHQS